VIVVAAGVMAAVTVLAGCAADSGGDEGAGERVAPSGQSTVAPPSGGDGSVAWIDECPSSGESVGRGDGLPELTLPCLGPGEPVQLAGLTGRPRLVNIWASWCGPCRAEMPWLQQAHDTGAVDVLGVDAEDQASAAGALLDELEVTFPSVYDPKNELAKEIRIVTKPTTLFVSKEGEVVFVLPGAFASYDEMRQLVSTHLGVELP
jgi:thiol-disulfide isomerase/thioredoxin